LVCTNVPRRRVHDQGSPARTPVIAGSADLAGHAEDGRHQQDPDEGDRGWLDPPIPRSRPLLDQICPRGPNPRDPEYSFAIAVPNQHAM
jgi:hypothetical protein